MEPTWILAGIAALAAALALPFVWPLSFAATLPAHQPVEVQLREGAQRTARKCTPGSGSYRLIQSILGDYAYRRTPKGLLGCEEREESERRLTLVCGDCAITVRDNGAVCVDGQSYTMDKDRSLHMLDRIRQVLET